MLQFYAAKILKGGVKSIKKKTKEKVIKFSRQYMHIHTHRHISTYDG